MTLQPLQRGLLVAPTHPQQIAQQYCSPSQPTWGKCRSSHSSVGSWMQCCREVTTIRSQPPRSRARLSYAPASGEGTASQQPQSSKRWQRGGRSSGSSTVRLACRPAGLRSPWHLGWPRCPPQSGATCMQANQSCPDHQTDARRQRRPTPQARHTPGMASMPAAKWCDSKNSCTRLLEWSWEHCQICAQAKWDNSNLWGCDERVHQCTGSGPGSTARSAAGAAGQQERKAAA